MFRTLAEYLVELYERTPGSARRLLDPLIRTAKIAAACLSELRLQVVLCECTYAAGKGEFAVLYVGRIRQLEPTLALFNSRPLRQTRLDSIFCWRIVGAIKQADALEAIPIANVNLWLYRRLVPRDLLPLLPSVKTILTLADTPEQTWAKFSESTRRKIRRVLDGEYGWQVERDKASLHYFYHRCYRPYALARFGEFAQIFRYQKVRRLFRTGMLVFIRRGEDLVAACICRRIDGTLWFELAGFDAENDELMDPGAGDALYYALLELAFEQRCTHINFRDTRPFLNDGSLQYKLRWGGRLVNENRAARQLAVGLAPARELRYHPFLEHYPVYMDGDRLTGLVLLPVGSEVSDRELRIIVNTYLKPELAKLRVWSQAGFAPGAPDCLVDVGDRVELNSLVDPNR
jgi:hypothetical protein